MRLRQRFDRLMFRLGFVRVERYNRAAANVLVWRTRCAMQQREYIQLRPDCYWPVPETQSVVTRSRCS